MNEDKTRKNVLFAVWYHSPSNKYTGNIEICLQYGGTSEYSICNMSRLQLFTAGDNVLFN